MTIIPITNCCPCCNYKVVSWPLFGRDTGKEWICRDCLWWVWKIQAWAKSKEAMKKKRDQKVFIKLYREYQKKCEPYDGLAVDKYLARTEDIFKEYIAKLVKAGVEYLRWQS